MVQGLDQIVQNSIQIEVLVSAGLAGCIAGILVAGAARTFASRHAVLGATQKQRRADRYAAPLGPPTAT